METPQASDLPDTFGDLIRAAQTLKDFPRPWCVCGGWAIDLFVNRVTRPHKDVDFAVWRHDQHHLRAYLAARGWSVEKAVGGRLLPWPEDEFIELPVHALWCRRPDARPDFCEVLLNEANDRQVLFRRDRAIMRSLAAAVIRSACGVPMLAPEIVLLYKANDLSHEGNRSDFDNTLPGLDPERRAWLRAALLRLHPGHEWLSRL